MLTTGDDSIVSKILERLRDRKRGGETNLAVGFDVFDTIVTRCIPKEFSFDFMCRGLATRYFGDPARAGVVRDAYQGAYIADCERNAAAGLCFEAKTEILFRDWAQALGSHGIDVTGDDILDSVIALEGTLMRVIPHTKTLIQTLHQEGIKLFYVSDMFLGKRAVDTILASFGLLEYFDFGIVSSDIARLKRTGALFDHLITSGQIDVKKTIFVGDDRIADYDMPSSRGIEAFHYYLPHFESEKAELLGLFKQAEADPAHWPRCLCRALSGFQFENLSAETAAVSKYLGLFYTNFAHFTYETYSIDEYSSVLFAAREGLLLKELCENFEAQYPVRATAKNKIYFPASRLSSFFLNLGDQGFGLAEAINTMSNGHPTLRNIFSFLRLSDDELNAIAIEGGLTSADDALNHPIFEWSPFQRIVDIVNSHPAMEAARAQGNLFFDFIRQQGVLDSKPKIVVDLGWSAQIQEYLWKGMRRHGADVSLLGVYAGTKLRAHWRRTPTNELVWYMADECHLNYSTQPILWFPQILEGICRSPHGTCLGFKRDADGTVLPVWDESRQPAERADDMLVARVQELILAYGRAYASLSAAYGISTIAMRDLAIAGIYKFLTYPEREIARCFCGISNVSDLGSAELFQGFAEEGRIGLDDGRYRNLARMSLWPQGLLSCFYGPDKAKQGALRSARQRWPAGGRPVDPGMTRFNHRAIGFAPPYEPAVPAVARAVDAYAKTVDAFVAHRKQCAETYARQELKLYDRKAIQHYMSNEELLEINSFVRQIQSKLDAYRHTRGAPKTRLLANAIVVKLGSSANVVRSFARSVVAWIR